MEESIFRFVLPVSSASLQITAVDIVANSLHSEMKGFFIDFTGNKRIPANNRILAPKFTYALKTNI